MKTCPPCTNDCSQSDNCPAYLARAQQAATTTPDAGSLAEPWHTLDALLHKALTTITVLCTVATVCGVAGYLYAKFLILQA